MRGFRFYSRFRASSDLLWSVSEPIIDRKSRFQARAIKVSSLEEANAYVKELGADKRIAKATHTITAVRVHNSSTSDNSSNDSNNSVNGIAEHYNNGGEPPAGEQILALMRTNHVVNALVVVHRWYGGIHLGGDRFRRILQCAREALDGLKK